MNAGDYIAAAVNLHVTRETAVLYASLVAAAASLMAAGTAGFVALRNEKSRKDSAVRVLTMQLDQTRVAERHKILRETSANFSLKTIKFAEAAAAVQRAMLVIAPGEELDSQLEQSLRETNAEIREQFQLLLLVTESLAVQNAARFVLRAAWNEREQVLGRTRKRGRITSEGEAIIKEMRAQLRPFMEAVRAELGISGPLADEPT